MCFPLFLRTVLDWHRPLVLTAALAGLVLAASLVGTAVDGRVLVGEPIWAKPARFALSIAVYNVTLAWLLSLVRPGGRRLGSVIAVLVGVELVAIVVQVLRGRRSHFNVETTLDALVFNGMGAVIMTVWAANVAVGVLLARRRTGDPAVTWAVRLGTVIALAGMPVALLMSPATPEQEAALAGGGSDVIGAHTVGAPDGGPGLPLVGWSTVAGDLRVPHFVGLHGLQVMILFALALTAVTRSGRGPRRARARVRLVVVVAAAYAGLFALTTWQALRGQSVVAPDALTSAVGGVLSVGTIAGVWWAVVPSGTPDGVAAESGARRSSEGGPGAAE
ncbi:hypothetical protein KIK06_21250 [Nocardiopsis sp. EMB25]|uniref:hypothetical protein n=1 Tax=Nocardiopsis sp. EMB25 TaxID=2835867 RepID=UPI00228439B7|nr:hypothetical protein [Nocardiopsis sp. EMB25]MCY9786426.1 hypothetical protein [Nocardiopsis sp. EMB25]